MTKLTYPLWGIIATVATTDLLQELMQDWLIHHDVIGLRIRKAINDAIEEEFFPV
jgi:hypothetical protein